MTSRTAEAFRSEPAPAMPDDGARVEDALARVLASEQFRSAPQLSSFLAFVVRSAREGRAHEIKGYTIATQALGRPVHFDPQVDPIVRVEAMRLRRALDAYYAGPGAGDPLRITLPRGGYVPRFEPAATDDGVPTRDPETADRAPWPLLTAFGARSGRPGWVVLLVVAQLVGLAGLIGWAGGRMSVSPRQDVATHTAPASTTLIPPPILALVEVSVADRDVPEVRRFTARVTEFLAKFEEIDVVDLGRGAPAASRGLTAPSLRYVLTLTAIRPFDGDAGDRGRSGIAARLTYGPTGQIVWASRIMLDQDHDPAAARLAAALGQPYGILFADLRSRTEIPDGARCLIAAFDYIEHPQQARHAEARDCLERMEAEGTGNVSTRFALTRLYLDEDIRGFNTRPGAVGRAMAVADAAMRAAPGSARARQALMSALFIQRAFVSAIEIGNQALSLNPGDSFLMAELGARYIAMGAYGEGMELVERSLALNPARPNAADFHLYVAARMTGDVERARHAAMRVAGRDPLLSLVARISAAVLSDETEEATRLVSELATLAPDFATNPQLALERMAISTDIAAAFAADLRKAGLVSASAVEQKSNTLRQ